MNLREIIDIRDRLKNELVVVEKFLEIAKRQGLTNGDGIDKNLSLVNGDQGLMKPVVDQASGGYGAIGNSVWEAIKLCPIEFTMTDISQSVKDVDQNVTKLQIATVLSRLTKQKKVQVIERKRGRKPAIYRRM